MTRSLQSTFLLLLALTLAPPADSAPSRASSRMRALSGRIQVQVRADAQPVLLDSLTAAAVRLGYELVGRDDKNLRLRLGIPAELGEVESFGWDYQGTESKQLAFEIIAVSKRPDLLAVVGAITLVQDPGAADEQRADLGKMDPYRGELKALLEGVRTLFSP